MFQTIRVEISPPLSPQRYNTIQMLQYYKVTIQMLQYYKVTIQMLQCKECSNVQIRVEISPPLSPQRSKSLFPLDTRLHNQPCKR